MQIFLTGGTGFIGRHLVPRLRAAGYQVRTLVRAGHTGLRAGALEQQGCVLVFGDLRSPQGWSAALEGVQAVVHLASLVEGSPRELDGVNAKGTAYLVQAAQRAGVPRLVYLSSVGARPHARWPYARSVWQAEQAIRRSSLDYVILRASVIVGPGDPFTGGLITLVRHWPVVPLPAGGRTRFQPLWIGDAVTALLRALEDPAWARQTLALGGGEVLSLAEMARALMGALALRKPIWPVPRGPLRRLVRLLHRWGVRTPFVAGHFLGRDHVAASLPEGFRPQGFRAIVPALVAPALCRC